MTTASRRLRALRRLSLRTLVEKVRTSLWFAPGLAVVVGAVLAAALSPIVVDRRSVLGGIVFPGGAESARSVLQAVAGSVITVTGVVFSLTVVTLQLASTQFSPRLLRTFLRDVSNQIVLGTFLATFTYSLVVLRAVRSGASPEEDVVPALAVTVAYGLTAASVFALVFFIDHIARSIRIDSLMREVNEDTLEAIEYAHGKAAAWTDVTDPEALPSPPPSAVDVHAPRAGFVQALDERLLLRAATRHDVVVCVEASVGTHLVKSAVLARCWSTRADTAAPPAAVLEVVEDAVRLGYERTMEQDIAFGLRQLVDVAVKALSPGVNDPTTAVHAVGHLSALLTELARCDLGPRIGTDDRGELRLILPGRDFAEFVSLACGQIRRYGAAEPAVTEELLRLLIDVSNCDLADPEVDVLHREADLIIGAAERETAEPRDLERLHELREELQTSVPRASTHLELKRPEGLAGA